MDTSDGTSLHGYLLISNNIPYKQMNGSDKLCAKWILSFTLYSSYTTTLDTDYKYSVTFSSGCSLNVGWNWKLRLKSYLSNASNGYSYNSLSLSSVCSNVSG